MDSQQGQSATTTTSSEMIQFSDSYNAQTIFDQVWEAPYEWFSLPDASEGNLPCIVLEMDNYENESEVLSETLVTAGMIEAAVIAFYLDYVSKYKNNKRTMVNYLEDLDANDVDAILQLACFGEIRYG